MGHHRAMYVWVYVCTDVHRFVLSNVEPSQITVLLLNHARAGGSIAVHQQHKFCLAVNQPVSSIRLFICLPAFGNRRVFLKPTPAGIWRDDVYPRLVSDESIPHWTAQDRNAAQGIATVRPAWLRYDLEIVSESCLPGATETSVHLPEGFTPRPKGAKPLLWVARHPSEPPYPVLKLTQLEHVCIYMHISVNMCVAICMRTCIDMCIAVCALHE